MSWPWPPGFLPPVTPISCCCTALSHIEQFGGILPKNLVASFHKIWWHPSALCLPSTPQLSSKLSSSKTSFTNSFFNAVVENPYNMASPL
jgi:hypothetical protein